MGLDHGVGHFRPLSITRQRHLLVYHYIAMSHEGLCQVFWQLLSQQPIAFQWLAIKGRKSNSYTNDIAYSNLEWTYRECWRDTDLSHWNHGHFDCKMLLRRTEEEGSGRRHDRSPDVCEVMTHEVYDGTLSIADEQMSCRIGCTLLMMSWLLICILPWRIPHDEITSLMCRRGSYLQFTR